jgi:hypothetical protein
LALYLEYEGLRYSMRTALLWGSILGLIVGYVVACSPVKFTIGDPPDGLHCDQQTATGCIRNYSEIVRGPKVDILFVNDNSASMSFEQRALANRFAGFIEHLDSKGVDYRIAITTTDIQSPGNEAREINGHGALQNGNLIAFGAGMPFLTASVPDRVARFNNTIVRPETLQCEQFIATYIGQNGSGSTGTADYQAKYQINCPSGDERGIYAANLTITNNPAGFLREDAYLAVIFLADEDERSGLYCRGPNNPNCNSTGFPLEEKDQPIHLFNAFKAKNKKDNEVEVHSIIVRPGDSACLTEQNTQTLGNPPVSATTGLVSGSVGSLYHTFTSAGWGDSISICMNNYVSALEQLADKIGSNKGILLDCENAQELVISPDIPYTRSGRSITFNPPPAPGTQIQLSYTCPLVQ